MNFRNQKMQRHLVAIGAMLLGSTLVLSTLVLINDSNLNNQETHQSAHTIIKISQPKPKPQELVQAAKPKPKPKPRRLNPPTPLLGLNSQLGGIDLGLDSLGIGQSDLDHAMLTSGGDTVMSEDLVDQVPRASFQAPVSYPTRARSKGIEGYVVFSLLIDATGVVEELRIIDANPPEIFNETATQAIKQWRFEPAKYQGKAVKTWAKQRIRFNLN